MLTHLILLSTVVLTLQMGKLRHRATDLPRAPGLEREAEAELNPGSLTNPCTVCKIHKQYLSHALRKRWPSLMSPFSRFEEGKLRLGRGRGLPRGPAAREWPRGGPVSAWGSRRRFTCAVRGPELLSRGGPAQSSSRPPPLRARQPGGVGVPGPGAPEAEPFSAPARSFTLSLVDEAARVPVALRASFADRTLAWVSPWGRKQLILAPFLFYPQRFFEVGQSQARPPGDTEQGCVPGGPPCQGSPPCTVARGPMGGGGPGTSIEGSSSWYSCWK